MQTFGEQVLQAGAGLASRTPEEIVNTDFKQYEAGGLKFGISQVEVTNRSQLAEYSNALGDALIKQRDSNGLNFAMLMVTDVVRRGSRLLITDDIAALEGLPYPKREDGTLNADGVVSRKMQLLPTILGALEG